MSIGKTEGSMKELEHDVPDISKAIEVITSVITMLAEEMDQGTIRDCGSANGDQEEEGGAEVD